MINVLVVGAKGQLSNNIEDISNQYASLNLYYKDYLEVDITDIDQIEKVFKTKSFHYCINCAAYTAVDMAEKESELAFQVNQGGSKNLALICKNHNVVLVHISTDFVFDGKTSIPYKEDDTPKPLGVYGQSKLKGELAIKEILKNYFIIRTSWLYSEHNANFMKTMIHLSENHEKLSVVDDQIGTPTYAKDVAKVILELIHQKSENYGLYHYSNEGVASWYDFAHAIFKETKSQIKLFPIPTASYPTLAKRPSYSVLNKTKIKKELSLEIPHWRDSLNEAVVNLNKM